MPADSTPFRFDGKSAIELLLRDGDGAPWVLDLSAGMEKFIGPYPRIDGFGAGDPLLVFRPAGQPA